MGILRGSIWGADLKVLDRPTTNSHRGYKVERTKGLSNLGVELRKTQGLTYNEVLERYSRDCTAYVAVGTEQTIAGWVWISRNHTEWAPPIKKWMHFQPEDTYCFDACILEPHRGQRLLSFLLTHVIADLRKAGQRYVWAGIEDPNWASRKSFARAGFFPCVRLMSVQLGPFSHLSYGRHPYYVPDDATMQNRALEVLGRRSNQVTLTPV